MTLRALGDNSGVTKTPRRWSMRTLAERVSRGTLSGRTHLAQWIRDQVILTKVLGVISGPGLT